MKQPICLSPVDAFSTFYDTGMDGIAIGRFPRTQVMDGDRDDTLNFILRSRDTRYVH